MEESYWQGYKYYTLNLFPLMKQLHVNVNLFDGCVSRSLARMLFPKNNSEQNVNNYT